MGRDRARSTVTVALLIVGAILVLWAIRFVLGLFVGLVRLALIGGLVLVGSYAVYRLWRGWADFGASLEPPNRP